MADSSTPLAIQDQRLRDFLPERLPILPLLPSRSALWIITGDFSATTQLVVFARRLARACT
jgi:hypothetical protein